MAAGVVGASAGVDGPDLVRRLVKAANLPVLLVLELVVVAVDREDVAETESSGTPLVLSPSPLATVVLRRNISCFEMECGVREPGSFGPR